jgi:hypothetical protein
MPGRRCRQDGDESDIRAGGPCPSARRRVAWSGGDEETLFWAPLALQLFFLRRSESMGNHDSEIVDADADSVG